MALISDKNPGEKLAYLARIGTPMHFLKKNEKNVKYEFYFNVENECFSYEANLSGGDIDKVSGDLIKDDENGNFTIVYKYHYNSQSKDGDWNTLEGAAKTSFNLSGNQITWYDEILERQ